MDARLVDLQRLSSLLGGADPEAVRIIEQIRQSAPKAWEQDLSSEKVSVGQVLENLLLRGQPSGRAAQIGLAWQLLIRQLGEALDTSSFDDARMMGGFAVEALAGLPCAELLYGRAPPPLASSRLQDIVLGHVTPEEAATFLAHWPEPDHDDPAPEIYAAREQIEEWLRSAADQRKSVAVVWM